MEWIEETSLPSKRHLNNIKIRNKVSESNKKPTKPENTQAYNFYFTKVKLTARNLFSSHNRIYLFK